MTKAKAQRWLKAVRELRQQYVDGTKVREKCPFCKLASKHCDACLWVIFSKTYCAEQMGRHRCKYNIEIGHTFSDPRWVKLSLARLSRWQKRLLAIIEGEGK